MIIKNIQTKIRNEVKEYYYGLEDEGQKIKIIMSNIYFEPYHIGIPTHTFYYDKNLKLLNSPTPSNFADIKEIENLILELEGLELRTK